MKIYQVIRKVNGNIQVKEGVKVNYDYFYPRLIIGVGGHKKNTSIPIIGIDEWEVEDSLPPETIKDVKGIGYLEDFFLKGRSGKHMSDNLKRLVEFMGEACHVPQNMNQPLFIPIPHSTSKRILMIDKAGEAAMGQLMKIKDKEHPNLDKFTRVEEEGGKGVVVYLKVASPSLNRGAGRIDIKVTKAEREERGGKKYIKKMKVVPYVEESSWEKVRETVIYYVETILYIPLPPAEDEDKDQVKIDNIKGKKMFGLINKAGHLKIT